MCLQALFGSGRKPQAPKSPASNDKRFSTSSRNQPHHLETTSNSNLYNGSLFSSSALHGNPPGQPDSSSWNSNAAQDAADADDMPPRGAGVQKTKGKPKVPTKATAKTAKAVGRYFSSGSASATPSVSNNEAKLDKLFDQLRNEAEDDKNALGVGSTMNYLTGLGLNPESGEIFVALELVQAPNFGEITRKGFIDGWKDTGASTSTAQSQYMRQLVSRFSSDPAYFKRVYRYTFTAGKEGDQRALAADNAKEFWKVLFTPPGQPWRSASYNWLDLWLEFLTAKWTRSVNRDMWNQTLEFANKTMQDETLGFWSEDSAWPSVIDDFVAWCRKEKGIGGNNMETDA